MKKFKKIFAGFMAMVSLFSIMSLSPAIAEYSGGQDISDYEIVDKGTIQIRKGGYKNIPESYDSLNINIEDESIVCISDTNYIGGYYNFEGLKNGITKISFIPFGSTKLYVYDIEVSDEFSNELEMPQAINLELYESNTLNLADPYDDGWYNVINRTSIYNEKAEWASDNESVVSVKNGRLTANSLGTATITAEINGIAKSCKVTVSKSNKSDLYEYVDMGTIKVRNDGIKILPYSNKAISYTCSNNTILNVLAFPQDNYPYVIAGLENGSARVTLTTFDNKIYAWNVEVSDQYNSDLEISQSTINLNLKETAALNIIDPYDDNCLHLLSLESIYNEKAEWTTDNESVVSVENGKLTAKAVGTATITAELNGITYKCDVTVSYLKGDVNKNGVVDLYDVITISEYIMHLTEFDETELALSDYNKDGVTDLYDAIEIAKTFI